MIYHGKRRTQMRPAFQLSGTEKLTEVCAAASHLTNGHCGQLVKAVGEEAGCAYPVGWSGTAVPALRSVNIWL